MFSAGLGGIVFSSDADHLVANDTNRVTDVFFRDLQGGSTLLVSTNFGSGPGNGASFGPSLSSDGRYVLFRTRGDQWMIHRMGPPQDPDRARLRMSSMRIFAFASSGVAPNCT